jgi:hypothetical protein
MSTESYVIRRNLFTGLAGAELRRWPPGGCRCVDGPGPAQVG